VVVIKPVYPIRGVEAKFIKELGHATFPLDDQQRTGGLTGVNALDIRLQTVPLVEYRPNKWFLDGK
jgi:hypothetical protein